MTGWVILAVYLAGYVLMWRTVVWAMINSFTFSANPDGVQVAGSVFIGSIGNLAWPVIFSGLAVRRIYRISGHGLDPLQALMPRSVRREGELLSRKALIVTGVKYDPDKSALREAADAEMP